MSIRYFLPLLLIGQLTFAQTKAPGAFDAHADVGNPALKGDVTYRKTDRSYTLRGAGYNIWFKRDEFQYLYKKLTGDFTLTAHVEFIGKGTDPHRKIGWMVRESLADTAVHVSAVAHGDGLVVMQWRTAPGAAMRDPQDEIFFPEKTLPQVMQLQRSGKTYTMRVGPSAVAMKVVGTYDGNLPDEVLGGAFHLFAQPGSGRTSPRVERDHRARQEEKIAPGRGKTGKGGRFSRLIKPFRPYFAACFYSAFLRMLLDLRSDTVTRPTPAMLEAMMQAPVGDDVFGDDPTVNRLEAAAAARFGLEAGLFCPSGTMTNQIALAVHLRAGEEVICHQESHIYLYEGGGLMANARASVRLLPGDRGRISAEQVEDAVNNPDDIHLPVTRLVSLENTMNKGGGSYYRLPQIAAIRAACDRHGLALHLDGARVFNALVETGEDPAEYGKAFDSLSVCLSKGLGCPVGSVLLGSRDFIEKARRVRKRLGGGWRQAGFLAGAGLYALDHHVERLREDHRRARTIGGLLRHVPEVADLLPVETNIVIFQLAPGLLATEYVDRLRERGILAAPFGKASVRFVTHLDFGDDQLAELEKRLVVPVAA